VDAGPGIDTGTTDTGTPDSGTDTGTTDSGTVDSGTDTGTTDSGADAADAADASCFTVPSGSTGVTCDSCMKSSPCASQRDICIAQCGPSGCADAWEGFLACIDLNPDAGGTLCASTWLSDSPVEANLASCGNTFCSSQCQ
jgi:hypothetical protein